MTNVKWLLCDGELDTAAFVFAFSFSHCSANFGKGPRDLSAKDRLSGASL